MKNLSIGFPPASGAARMSAPAQVSTAIDIDTSAATRLETNFSPFDREAVFPAQRRHHSVWVKDTAIAILNTLAWAMVLWFVWWLVRYTRPL